MLHVSIQNKPVNASVTASLSAVGGISLWNPSGNHVLQMPSYMKVISYTIKREDNDTQEWQNPWLKHQNLDLQDGGKLQ